MKICYINPTFLIRRPIANMIGLLGDKHEIGIFVPRKAFQKVDENWHSNKSLKKSKIYSYSAINIPFINFEWPIPITPMFFINLIKIFLKYKVIHMWTYFYINSWFVLLFKLLFGNKLVMSSDTFPGYSLSSGKLVDFLFRVYTTLFGWFLFSVPNTIHLYGKSLIKFAKKIGIKKSKIKVLSTGIFMDKFAKGRNIRNKLGFGKNDVVLVYAGLMVPRKGIDVMIRVLKKLNNKNVKLLLIGEGPAKDDYLKMAKKLKVDDQIVFSSWRTDIPDVFKSVDVLFLPSRGEGLPGIVMEAMACGLPAVASNIPCIPDLIESGKTGFLAKMDDIGDFTDKLKILTNDKKLRISMGRASQEKIKRLEWADLAPQYLGMYQ